MNVFIAVVSHLHSELIKKIDCLNELNKQYQVVVKSNKEGDDFSQMNFQWLNNGYGLGFGENNNIIFNYCRSELGMTDDDYFVVLNPDVDIEPEEILKLTLAMSENNHKVAAINLYKDKNRLEYDNSVRSFPTIKDFFSSFFLKKNTSILDKGSISTPSLVDWAAGSFLAFQVGHYAELRGFDERYFMYCEDIDICYRSNRINTPVIYYPNVVAIHLAQHANRKLFSKHFYWHVTSIIRFFVSKTGLVRNKSSVNGGN